VYFEALPGTGAERNTYISLNKQINRTAIKNASKEHSKCSPSHQLHTTAVLYLVQNNLLFKCLVSYNEVLLFIEGELTGCCL